MQVQEAIASRRSVRDFLPTPVPGELIRRVLSQALRAPSGGNLQPWFLHVVGGERLTALKTLMRDRLAAGTVEAPEYDVYPRELLAPYRDRRFQIGEDMYATMGVPREDKAARRRWFARNYECFGAPLALFCTMDKRHGPPQWSDAGMLLQTIMLLLRAEGLDSCPQESWANYPQTLREFLGIPPERILFTGLAIGHANPEHPVNRLVAQRAPLEEVAQFDGI